MKLLFAHGWGFDRHFWDATTALLANFDCMADDRGYFREPGDGSVEGPCVAVTHSFGTMRVLAAPPPGLVGIVAFNGFDRFTAAPERAGVAPRVLDRMVRRFADQPRAVLDEFRRVCGAEPLGALRDIDVETLEADLRRMRDAAPPPAVPVLVIHGNRDPLLPTAMRAASFADRPDARIEHVDGGHLLPIEAPALCAAAVRGMARP